MSSPMYIDKNSFRDSNIHTQNDMNLTKLESHPQIRVRFLRESDQVQVRELFRLATSTGGKTPILILLPTQSKS